MKLRKSLAILLSLAVAVSMMGVSVSALDYAEEPGYEEPAEEENDTTEGDDTTDTEELGTFTVINGKGEFTVTDEQASALGATMGATNTKGGNAYVISEESSIKFNGKDGVDVNQIFAAQFSYIDIVTDSDGNISFENRCSAISVTPFMSARIWMINYDENYDYDYHSDSLTTVGDTIAVSNIVQAYDAFNNFAVQMGESPYGGFSTVDMVVIQIYYDDEEVEFNYGLPTVNSGNWFYSAFLTENGVSELSSVETDDGVSDGSDDETTDGSDDETTDGSDDETTDGSDDETTDGSDDETTDGSDDETTDGSDDETTDGSDDETADDSEDETTDDSDDGENANPDTGALLTVAPIILSAIAITVSRKRK